MSRCKETSGILLSRPCPNPAVRRCARTGRPICDACTRWIGQEAVSISAMKAEMADLHRRGEPVGGGRGDDLFLFPYALMGAGFTASDYALFDAPVDEALAFDDAYEGDWEGS